MVSTGVCSGGGRGDKHSAQSYETVDYDVCHRCDNNRSIAALRSPNVASSAAKETRFITSCSTLRQYSET